MTAHCPTCGQPVPERKAARICFDCGKPITRHAKWMFAVRNGQTSLVHRHCGNPESYDPPGVDRVEAPAPLFARSEAA